MIGEEDFLVIVNLLLDGRDLSMFRCVWEGPSDRLCMFGGKKSKTSFSVTCVSSAK